MTSKPYSLSALGLQGFRAYLEPKEFDFSTRRCLAVFAPNGKGKSSMIDALEFMFSADGSLERLGVRAINNNAGVAALAHNLADERKIVPTVSICFTNGTEKLTGARIASGNKRTIPEAASTIGAFFVVSPIIRGHALRNFVEAETAEQRYVSVANWLQLSPLVDVQKNLRLLRQQVKAASEDEAAFDRVDALLARETAKALVKWDDSAVIAYVNDSVIAPLDKNLQLTALDGEDAAVVEVAMRAKAEEKQLGLEGMLQIRKAAAALHSETTDPELDAPEISGAITDFEKAVFNVATASDTLEAERVKAANATFSKLWQATQPFFAEGVLPPDACPVCETPIAATTAGSAAVIRDHLAAHMADLADYADAKTVHEEAVGALTKAHTRLVACLKALSLPAGNETLKALVGTYSEAIAAWKTGAAPDAVALKAGLNALNTNLDAQIQAVKDQQGEHTYLKALATVRRFLEMATERALAARTREELKALSESLTTQAAFITAAIRQKVQALLDTLQIPMNAIYREIQGDGAAPVRLELPPEEDANQQRLNLLIDFADNRQGVQPGGYLSDSQIHSLALAFRLAAIRRFNCGARIFALDDIVTSYDADHRKTIAALIAKEFADCQLLITTHDERFFLILKDQLSPSVWHFTRITKLDADYGPRFADHKITEAMIQARWDKGESAANEIRQAEEEWLLSICREFGVNVRIRSLEKAYSYDRGELAVALATFLKGAKLDPPAVIGVNNRFLVSLQQGVIENFGSHFQDVPYGDGSIGDEKARWAEFTAFKEHFVCHKCSRVKFKRPLDLKKPVCADRNCEAQFEFAAPPVKPAVA